MGLGVGRVRILNLNAGNANYYTSVIKLVLHPVINEQALQRGSKDSAELPLRPHHFLRLRLMCSWVVFLYLISVSVWSYWVQK